MTTSPYDTLPTGKQALAPTSGESIEEKPSITGHPAAPADPLPSAKAPNPITDPYGGYEEISLEEAARLDSCNKSITRLRQQSDCEPKFRRSGFCKAGCVAAGIRARHCYEKNTVCRISSH